MWLVVVVLYEIDFLLIWNCRHIANPDKKPYIEQMIRDNGYHVPILITPHYRIYTTTMMTTPDNSTTMFL
jgi:hypothetical protein